MLNLRRRLSKLESQLTDRTGLVPYTKQWLDYWLATYERLAKRAGRGRARMHTAGRVAGYCRLHAPADRMCRTGRLNERFSLSRHRLQMRTSSIKH